MISIRVFKPEKGDKKRVYYAVTGAKSAEEAVKAVVKYTKINKKRAVEFLAVEAVIAPYKKGFDGLWEKFDHDGEPCFMVWRP